MWTGKLRTIQHRCSCCAEQLNWAFFRFFSSSSSLCRSLFLLSLCVFFQLFLRSTFTNKRLDKRRQTQQQQRQQQFRVEPGLPFKPKPCNNLRRKLKRRRPKKRGCATFLCLYFLCYARSHTHTRLFWCPLQLESAQTYLLMTFIKVHFHQDTIRQWAFCMAHRTITDGWVFCLPSRYFHFVFLLCVFASSSFFFFNKIGHCVRCWEGAHSFILCALLPLRH